MYSDTALVCSESQTAREHLKKALVNTTACAGTDDAAATADMFTAQYGSAAVRKQQGENMLLAAVLGDAGYCICSGCDS